MQGVPKIKKSKLWVTKSIQEYVFFDILWFFFGSRLYSLYRKCNTQQRLWRFDFVDKRSILHMSDFDRI